MRLPALAVTALLALAVPPVGARQRPGESELSHADAEIAFAQGLGAFQRGELTAAAERFAAAVGFHPENGSARYWLGVTYVKLGKPREAVAQIARSLRAREPPRSDRWRVLAHLGAAKRAAGEDRGAERSFRKALAQGDEEARRVVERARALAPEAIAAEVAAPRYRGPFWPPERPLRWEGRLGVASGDDSNPHILDDELILNAPDGSLVRGSEPDRFEELRLLVAHYPFHDRRGWNLGLTLDARRAFYHQFDDLDLGRGRFAVHLARGRDPLSYVSGPLGYTRVPYGHDRTSALFQLGYLYARLGGETYVQGTEAAATFILRENNVTATQVELAFQDRDFGETPFEDRDRSGVRLTLEVSQLFYLGQRDRYLRLGVAAGDNNGGRAYARSFLEVRAEASLPFNRKWSLLFAGSAGREEYDFPESNLFSGSPGPMPREDTTVRAVVRLVRSLTPELKLVADLGRTDRDAELELPPGIPGLDYQRTRASLGLRWFF